MENDIAVRVRFLLGFPDLFGEKAKVIRLAPKSDVRELLRILGDTPERRRTLLTGEELNAQVVVLINGTPIRAIKGMATELAHDDNVVILPFVAGG